MKKLIFMLIAVFVMAIGANAQEQSNYTGSSKFTDNVAVTLQYGVGLPMQKINGERPSCNLFVLGVEKYFNPVFGVGLEGRAAVGAEARGETVFGSINFRDIDHTFVDRVNVSAYAKANVANAIWGYKGERRLFEPVLYTGIGWGHTPCSDAFDRNYMTYRAGVELNFNLGEKKAWAIVVNPSVVWGGIDNGKLQKSNGGFEITAGVAYRFKTSNGTHSFVKPVLYNQTEIDELNASITELRAKNEDLNKQLAEKPTVVVKEVEKIVYVKGESTYVVTFAQGSATLTDAAKGVLDTIGENSIVKIEGTASPEGSKEFNQELSERRAKNAAEYLENRGLRIASAEGLGVTGPDSNRLVIVKVQ